jgi:ribosomal protein S13
MLDELYRIDMAFDACKGVTPTAGDMLRLETTIAFVEEKTGFEEDELDELYGLIEREAIAGGDFCMRMTDAVERLRAIPQDHR